METTKSPISQAEVTENIELAPISQDVSGEEAGITTELTHQQRNWGDILGPSAGFCGYVSIFLTLGICGLTIGGGWNTANSSIMLILGGSSCLMMPFFFWEMWKEATTKPALTTESAVDEASAQEVVVDNTSSELAQLRQEKSLYQKYFAEQTKLADLKNQLGEEEKEWLEIYLAAQAESESSNFARQQKVRAQQKIGKKLTSEEVEKLLELIQVQKQLEDLQTQEQQAESSTQAQLLQIEISPK